MTEGIEKKRREKKGKEKRRKEISLLTLSQNKNLKDESFCEDYCGEATEISFSLSLCFFSLAEGEGKLKRLLQKKNK